LPFLQDFSMAVELTDEQIHRVLQGISVPPQPQIMVDLQMEQVMPEPDLSNIARLISQDPGLSGALLKTVNSSFFGLASRIASIGQAVNLLGCNSVINLINAQSIKGELSDDAIVALNRFWDTAQDVAMVSLTLAKRIGYPSPRGLYARAVSRLRHSADGQALPRLYERARGSLC